MTASLGELLRQSASRYPDRPALVGDDLRLTYSELLTCVEGIADRLGASGVPSGAKVGLSVNRGAAALLGSAAIMLHGCAYVPLPVGSHSGRLQHMVGQAALDWALCDVQGGQTLAGFDLTVVDLGPDDFVPRPTGDTRPAVTPDTSAYVIFTSGSTGAPKGVEVTHGNVLALLADAVPLFGFGTDEAWPLQHGYEFDVSVWEMWAAISVGATLIAIPGDGSDPQALAEGLLRHHATRLHIVPSIFRHLCEVVAEEDIKVPLRNVTFAGEALHHGAIQDWMRSQPEPHPQWLNAYGITETTVYNTVHELSTEDLTKADPATPIGPPYPNSPVVVVNAELTQQPDGTVGELYIGGRQVTLGYVGNPALTAERFRELPGRDGIWYQTGDLGFVGPDGGLRYVGRADDQVKIRGTRVELGEVEHALRALPWVRDAAAAVHQSGRAEPVLAAAVVAESVVDDRTALQQVRRALKGMPAYLVPSRIIVVERLPLNSNGKTDRRAVTALFD